MGPLVQVSVVTANCPAFAPVIVPIHLRGEPELVEIGHAADAAGGVLAARQRGQQQRGEQRDDGDGDEQLDERERAPAPLLKETFHARAAYARATLQGGGNLRDEFGGDGFRHAPARLNRFAGAKGAFIRSAAQRATARVQSGRGAGAGVGR